MAISAKYFITDQRGNYIDWSAHISGFSLLGKEVQLIGGAGDDALYVQAGTSADISNMGGGVNTLYLTGNLTDYTQTIDQQTGVYTFTRTAGLAGGQSEVVKFTVGDKNDVVYFADGHLTINAATDPRLFDGTTFQSIQAGWLTVGAAPASPVTTAATTATTPAKVFIVDAQGLDVPTLMQPGQAMELTGSGAVDTVYINAWTSVDASNLGGGNDRLYLLGNLAGYTQTIDQQTGVYTFARSVGGQNEMVKFTVSDQDDVVYFADGHISVNAATDNRLHDGTAFQTIQAAWLTAGGTPGPSVTIATNDSALKVGDTATLTFTLSEAPGNGTTFVAGDVVVTGGSLSDFSGSGTSYTATFTPTSGSTTAATVSIAGGAFSNAAGQSSVASQLSMTVDTIVPVIQSMTSSGNQVVLTYDTALDSGSTPAPESFAVSVNAAANAVINVAVADNIVTLTLTTSVPTGAGVQVGYTVPVAGTAIQDMAGNIADNFTTGIVADGYIRGAQIYIDTNGNGNADANEALAGVMTDYSGNFFLPTNAPVGTIIAVGGQNIDTGLPNTMPLTAPTGSVMVSPLTTLVQAYMTANAGTDVASASTAVATALGLPGGKVLTAYNPIAALSVDANDATALAVQKAAVQVATLTTMAASAPVGVSSDNAANTVTANLVAQMGGPASINSVNLADTTVITSALGASSSADVATIVAANTAINNAANLTAIATVQNTYLDTADASLFDYFARAGAFMASGSLDLTMDQVRSALTTAYESGTKYLAYVTTPPLSIGPGIGLTSLFDLADIEKITTEGRGGYAGNLYGQVTTWINAEGSLFSFDAGYSPFGVIEMGSIDRYATDPTQQWDLTLASVTFAGITLSTDGALAEISTPTSVGISLLDFSVNVGRFEVDFESLSGAITGVFSQTATSIADNIINSVSDIAASFHWFTPTDGIEGSAANDTLYGTYGNDVMYGNEGDDNLYGGSGDDTYRYRRDEGTDRIFEAGDGVDRLEIWDNSSLVDLDNFNDLRFMRSGSNLVISLAGC